MECVIVDDEMDNLIICEKYVRKFGVTPRVFSDPEIALNYCINQKTPDFIILDWHMPKMEGPEFLAKMIEEFGAMVPPVIMCTCENQQELIVQAINQGAVGYIVKPFQRNTLLMQLTQLGIIMPRGQNTDLVYAAEKNDVKKITF